MTGIPIEDLISSLNSTNLGTEARELAKLQAQLQQALQAHAQATPFPTSPVQSTYCHNGPPTNTPTARTPSGPSWGQFADANNGRRRRSSSAGSTLARGRQIIREEDEDRWRHGDANRNEMEQDMMEDVEEEAQVDADLYSTASPLTYSHPSASTPFGHSPTSYGSTDPFLAAQLQAAEQRSLQPSFFAQAATAQSHTSPFYGAAHQSQPPQAAGLFQAQGQPLFFVPPETAQTRTVPYPLTIETGHRLDPAHVR